MKNLLVTFVCLLALSVTISSAQDSLRSVSWEKPVYAKSLTVNGDRSMLANIGFTSLSNDSKSMTRIDWFSKFGFLIEDSAGCQEITNFIIDVDFNNSSSPYKVKNDWKHHVRSGNFGGIGLGIDRIYYNARYSIHSAIGFLGQNDSAKNDQRMVVGFRLAGSADIAIYESLGLTVQTDLLIGSGTGVRPSASLIIGKYFTKSVGYRSLKISAGLTAQNLLLPGENEYLWGPVIKAKAVSEESIIINLSAGYHPTVKSVFFTFDIGLEAL